MPSSEREARSCIITGSNNAAQAGTRGRSHGRLLAGAAAGTETPALGSAETHRALPGGNLTETDHANPTRCEAGDSFPYVTPFLITSPPQLEHQQQPEQAPGWQKELVPEPAPARPAVRTPLPAEPPGRGSREVSSPTGRGQDLTQVVPPGRSSAGSRGHAKQPRGRDAAGAGGSAPGRWSHSESSLGRLIPWSRSAWCRGTRWHSRRADPLLIPSPNPARTPARTGSENQSAAPRGPTAVAGAGCTARSASPAAPALHGNTTQKHCHFRETGNAPGRNFMEEFLAGLTFTQFLTSSSPFGRA